LLTIPHKIYVLVGKLNENKTNECKVSKMARELESSGFQT
jgi:hypothetical protein